jgi:fructuronate reductase
VRLSNATVAHIPPSLARPTYDRTAQKAGIVHFGIGAFHRAHQAWYTDVAMNAGDRDWGIIGVSLRSASVAGQMNPQDGLFSLSQRSGNGVALRVVGSVQRVLVAARDTSAIVAALASPDLAIVSFTITEKGYCRTAAGALDLDLNAEVPIYTFLTAGLRRRKAAGLPGLTLLSCDNLAQNGEQLQKLIQEYLAHNAPDLIPWFEAECTCPSTMVDRIVPAATPQDRAAIAQGLGMIDEAAVVAEPYSQWVIEDHFVGKRPKWEVGGAQFTANVHAYETAKLRMLNGAHSALAYLGLERGHDYVHQAIVDPALRPLIETLMRDEAATSLVPAPEQNLDAYADALLARFANPALNHKLSQIAMDGSQKIPQRWLETLAYHRRDERRCPAILAALAAWTRHVRGDGMAVDDPMASQLAMLWRSAGHDGVINALFGASGIFAHYWIAEAGEIIL